MSTTSRGTNPGAATAEPVRPGDAGVEPTPAAHGRRRPVESVTRVTVAFPFGTIRIGEPEVWHVVRQLAELVADLAAELQAGPATAATAELVERARTLVHTVPAG
jgi:hypothetical protein